MIKTLNPNLGATLSLCILTSLSACGGNGGGQGATAETPAVSVSAPAPAPAVIPTQTSSLPPAPTLVETPLETMGDLNFSFLAKVDGEDLKCSDSSPEMKTKGQIFTDLRLFISNLVLVNDKGEDVKLNLATSEGYSNLQYRDEAGNTIALLNYLDASCAASDATQTLKDSILGALPYGRYTALKFQLGLPYPAMDASLTKIPAALAPTDMAWMWEHFPADFQLETRASGKKKIFNALTSKEKTVVVLALDNFVHDKDAKAPTVALDLSKLFLSDADTFLSSTEKACSNGNTPMTEASPNCAHAFKSLGLPVQNPKDAYTQTVFSIVP